MTAQEQAAPEAKPKLSPYRWVTLLMTCLVCIMANYMQYQVSALAVSLMPMLNIDQAGFSMLMLMPMLTAVFLSIPAGTLADKNGPKKVVTICLIVSVIGAFLRAGVMSFPVQVISMFLIGFGIASLNANLIKILSAWFGGKAQVGMGFFFASADIGVIGAQMLAPQMPSVQFSYTTAAIALLVVTILWAVFMKNAPKGASVAFTGGGESPMKYFKVAVKSRNVWFVGLCYGFSMAAVTAFAGFIPQALINMCGASALEAGGIASMASIGSFFGCILGPVICDRLGKWKPYLVITTIIGTLLMCYFWFIVLRSGTIGNYAFVCFMMILSGAFGAINGPIVQAMPYALPDIRGKYAGSAGGIVGTIGLLCSYFIPIIVSAAAGGNYLMNFGIESLVFLAAIIWILAIPELGPKGKVAQEIRAREAANAPEPQEQAPAAQNA